ncbi:ferredoxin [Tenggerimyces flavus]|uniref:Ferredoxin n=1 Tax=Tenggerimyces flavus TaxID=1708749 RepID=A0ABV7YAA6_9ACTN|nr:(4Fe-4S)-binding protein [Tenggerimyces flavus]MBM7785710.1 ferredoxin [Tenggerimyces flavus]
MRLEVDRDVCIGSGNCVLTAPDIFDQDDDGVVTLLVADPDADSDTRIREAVERCPSGALAMVQREPAR